MAENPKSPHDLPPLADKGAARPLAQSRPDERPAADTADRGDEKRPSGLHTRPDLFGSSAVMPRPDRDSAEERDAEGTEKAGEDPAEGPVKTPALNRDLDSSSEGSAGAAPSERDQATFIGRPSSGDDTMETPASPAPRALPVGEFLPVANLQDQPLRIPDSIAFEDWPDHPDSELEAGARSPEGASMATAEPDAEKPAPSEEPSAAPQPAGLDLAASGASDPKLGEPEMDDLAVPEKPAEAASPPDWQAPDWQAPERQSTPPADQPNRLQDLMARLETGIDLRRLPDTRWLLPTGIAACAILLVAGLAGGIIPIPGEDRETAQLAQDLEAPAAGDPDPAAPGQRDVPVAPAGSDLGNESAAEPLPEEPQASQLAALPEPGGPSALDLDREPIVDFMRIDPDGKAVVAGRAAPGTELTVLDNGEPLGSVTADIYGLWTFVSQDPLSSGRHEIGLRVKNQGSEVSSEPVLVTDGGTPRPEEPEQAAERADLEKSAEIEDLMTAAPEGADFSQDLGEDFQAPEQLAAAAPATPVQSDASTAKSPGEPASAAAEETAAAPSPAESVEIAAAPAPSADPAQATDEEPAEQPAEEAAAEPAAAVTSTAPAPEPKPEPPAETQIAKAVPAGGDYVIQFASFLNPETAVREQAVLEERFSDLLSGHEVFVQQVDIAEQGTFYRVRLGPFTSLAEARTVCSRFQERERDCLAMAR